MKMKWQKLWKMGARHRAPVGSDCSFEMESGAPLPKQWRTSLTMLKIVHK